VSILRWLLFAVVLTGCGALPDRGAPVTEAAGAGQSRAWSDFALPGKRRTRYTAQWLDGQRVVRAESDGSASMYRRMVRLEPGALGKARFSWRVEDLIKAADLRDRDAEDSPVRLLFAFDGDVSRLSQRNRLLFEMAQALTGEAPPYATLMYVWDNHAAPESVIHAGRTDRIRKIVLESGAHHLGQWRHYERDLAADFRRAFGEDPGALISIGLMTDSDNTHSSASAWYGEVRLCAREGSTC
jgi:hypothetical protein